MSEETIIIPEVTECPVCGERDYIEIVFLLSPPTLISVTCLSCGYDDSMTNKFPESPE